MDRIDNGAPMDPESSLGWRFPLRRVAFREAGQLLAASVGPFRAAPLRLTGMFLLAVDSDRGRGARADAGDRS